MTSNLRRLARDFSWTPNESAIFEPDTGVWLVETRKRDASVYSDDDWDTMDPLIESSWWFDTRNKIILKTAESFRISNEILDVGSGNGFVARFLASKGYSVLTVEPSLKGAVLSARKGLSSICAELHELKLPGDSIPTVSMFDVLEHVEDRADVLAEVSRVLMPGGTLLLTLPALNSLWSGFDNEAGHFLRYSKSEIQRELESADMSVISSKYFFSLTVAPIFLIRVIPYRLGMGQTTTIARSIGGPGGILGRVAQWFECTAAGKLPFGSSLIVVARKDTGRI